jgi:hypothetical protein
MGSHGVHSRRSRAQSIRWGVLAALSVGVAAAACGGEDSAGGLGGDLETQSGRPRESSGGTSGGTTGGTTGSTGARRPSGDDSPASTTGGASTAGGSSAGTTTGGTTGAPPQGTTTGGTTTGSTTGAPPSGNTGGGYGGACDCNGVPLCADPSETLRAVLCSKAPNLPLCGNAACSECGQCGLGGGLGDVLGGGLGGVLGGG